jgi:hypothetical protein
MNRRRSSSSWRELARRPDRTAKVNAALCLGLGTMGLVTMAAEGYLTRVDVAFAAFVVVVLGGALASAVCFLSTPRLLALFSAAGLFGLATQAVGTGVGAWRFSGTSRYYVFFAFGVGSLFNFGLVRILARQLERARLP